MSFNAGTIPGRVNTMRLVNGRQLIIGSTCTCTFNKVARHRTRPYRVAEPDHGRAHVDGTARRLYCTRSGDSALCYRSLSPDSGVIYPIATRVTGVDIAATSGLILSENTLYVAYGNSRNLSRATLNPNGFAGGATTVSGPDVDGVNWSANALFTDP
jgi:hypothetical protein